MEVMHLPSGVRLCINNISHVQGLTVNSSELTFVPNSKSLDTISRISPEQI